MQTSERPREIMTPDQVADYLRVNRETDYRYIREGKLSASKLGRSYRITTATADLLLRATRTRKDINLREYSSGQIDQFMRNDALSPKARRIIPRTTGPTDLQPFGPLRIMGTHNRPYVKLSRLLRSERAGSSDTYTPG